MINGMKINKRLLISFILNLVTSLLVLIGAIVAYIVGDGTLASRYPGIFKYFTFQSNIFMGIVCLFYAFNQLQMMKGKKDKINHVLNIFYHIGATAIGLTFVIVITVLAPGYGFDKMYNYANLFFHALAPATVIINYLFFNKECHIRIIDTLFSIIPPFSYGLVYFIVVQALNGYGDINIDFYLFGKDGPLFGALYYLIIVTIAYVVGLVLNVVNNLVFKKAK